MHIIFSPSDQMNVQVAFKTALSLVFKVTFPSKAWKDGHIFEKNTLRSNGELFTEFLQVHRNRLE